MSAAVVSEAPRTGTVDVEIVVPAYNEQSLRTEERPAPAFTAHR